MALGQCGMALGALLAMLPPYWEPWLHGALAFRPLFVLSGLAAGANLVLLGMATEQPLLRTRSSDLEARQRHAELSRVENRVLVRLFLVNSFNGLAIGLTGPLISYWFALRFQVGPAAIAPVMAATFAVTAALSLLTGRLTRRVGLVRPVIWARLVSLALLAALPLTPWFWLASLVYLLRSALARGSAGAQQALTVGLVRDERRGLASSLNAASFQLPRTAGLSMSGVLLDAGQYTLPFLAAAGLQAVYLYGYHRLFRAYEPPLEDP